MHSTIATLLLLLHQTRAFFTPTIQTRHSTTLYQYAYAGSPKVDMNRYNIPLSQCTEQWTAVLQAKTSLQEEGIFLKPKNDRELFVDTLYFSVKRHGGLGLLLTELAGREDGVGITIVEEVLPDGNSMNVGILPGDSIVALTIQTNVGEGRDVAETRTSVSTECLSYDATIDQITSLPAPTSTDETVQLTIKRLRRQPKVNVRLQYPPQLQEPDINIELFAGENLRRAMLTRGIKLNDPLAMRFDSGGSGDCGSDGTCATCVVGISKGMELLSPMKETEGQILKKKPRWRMACKAVVGHGMQEGDMTIQVNPRQWEV
jgi:ferredoxin